MKKLPKILLGIFAVLLIALIVFFPKLKRLNHVLSLFDEDKIVENFRSFDQIMPVSRLEPSSNPYAYKIGEGKAIPPYFTYEGKRYQSEAFLEQSKTTGLLVIQDDVILLEKYYLGNTPTTKNISWSMSKSFISALIGIAIEEGHIKNLQQTADEFCPILKGSGYEGVTLKNILQMSTGVGFDEDYGDFNSDINRWGRGFALGKSQDAFAATLKNERPQGTFNHYVSINTHVLGMILTKATGNTVSEYMQEKFWNPMGMQDDCYWIIDSENMEGVLGLLNATMRDYAKIGSLYLNEGKFNGIQIVPAEWVKASVTPDAPHLMPGENDLSTREFGYGYQWWIPGGGDGEFMAQGVYNQNIYVNPTTRTVIVKLSANDKFTNPDFLPSRSTMAVEFFREVAYRVSGRK